MKSRCLILAFAIPFICSAQNDSTIIYVNKYGETTTKDSAFIYSVKTKRNNLFHVVTYFSSTNKLQSEGDFMDDDMRKPVGKFDNYKEDGNLDNTINYANGNAINKTYYFSNGNKKSYIAYSASGTAEQKGWDEDGKEISPYITEQEARFNGSWNKYLEKNINPDVAANAGMAPGVYTVTVHFTVNQNGDLINVGSDATTGNCKACAAEAIRVVASSPTWQPAILNNEPVIYRQRQNIGFQVVENKKRGKN